ncbi:MBL fold metallo-hydrolase [Alkalibaculum sporogenes]|nr:MBL fold metallo-hydrolase [Alkalibaculum sporogenes]
MKIYYIANTGFLLEHNDKKVLIDAIHTKQVDPYHSVDPDTINKIIAGAPPFNDLDLLLFTHYHWDHFDGETSLEVLINQPKLKLFSSKQTVQYLKTLSNYNTSLDNQIEYGDVDIKDIKEFNVNGINFSVASMIHDGAKFSNVVNFSYIVKMDGITVFHCGDAKPDQSNYESFSLYKQNISIALLDFPYVSLIPGRKVINTFITPQKILLMHLPNEKKDIYNWISTTNKIIDRYGHELPEIILCEDLNTTVVDFPQ